MSYEKHTWETGEIITAENLNHLENGVLSCGNHKAQRFEIVLSISPTDSTLIVADRTIEEFIEYLNGLSSEREACVKIKEPYLPYNEYVLNNVTPYYNISGDDTYNFYLHSDFFISIIQSETERHLSLETSGWLWHGVLEGSENVEYLEYVDDDYYLEHYGIEEGEEGEEGELL